MPTIAATTSGFVFASVYNGSFILFVSHFLLNGDEQQGQAEQSAVAIGIQQKIPTAFGGRFFFQKRFIAFITKKIMQIKLFTVPAFDSHAANEELNKWLRSHRVLEVQQEFVAAENGAYWCFSVKYIQGEQSRFYKKEKIDYRKVLEPAIFKVFSKLRDYRKQIAKEDAVPAYAVFTDAELAAIAQLDPMDFTHLKTIKGIGEKKVEKYGKLMIEMYQKDEKNRQSDSKDN